MINLLPPREKQDYEYARRNVHLLHWVIGFAFAFIGLAALGTGGFIYLERVSSNYQRQVDQLETSLQSQKLSQTQAEAKDISNSLKLAVQVLGKEVLFSKLLDQLASVIPNDTRLSTLDISQTSGALDVTAQAADYAAATQLQVNLAAPGNKIFSKADIVSISCASGSGGAAASAYPCTVVVRALFAANNPFLFINAGGKAS